MRKDERAVYFFDAKSKAWTRKFPEGLPGFPHYLLAKELEKLFKADLAVVMNGQRQQWYVQDMRVLDDRCEMLLNFSDTGAADPTLMDRPKRRRRTVRKVGDEGMEHSAHIVWEYKSRTNNEPCVFKLEAATGLGGTKVGVVLRRMLRTAQEATDVFTTPDPDAKRDDKGNFLKIPARPLIELAGHPSKEFLDDLRRGELTEVELYTKKSQGTKWDAAGAALIETESVLVRPNPKRVTGKALALLKKITPQKADKYEYARVKFKSESDIEHTVRVFSENHNLVNEDKYLRKERIIEIGDNLPTGFEAINTVIMSKIRALT